MAPFILNSPGPGYYVQGAHTYAASGSYAMSIHIIDGVLRLVDGQAMHAEAGVAFDGQVGVFGPIEPGTVAGDYDVTIDWGDGQTSDGTVLASGASFRVTGSHTYGQSGDYTPVLHVIGGRGITVPSTATIG